MRTQFIFDYHPLGYPVYFAHNRSQHNQTGLFFTLNGVAQLSKDTQVADLMWTELQKNTHISQITSIYCHHKCDLCMFGYVSFWLCTLENIEFMTACWWFIHMELKQRYGVQVEIRVWILFKLSLYI